MIPRAFQYPAAGNFFYIRCAMLFTVAFTDAGADSLKGSTTFLVDDRAAEVDHRCGGVVQTAELAAPAQPRGTTSSHPRKKPARPPSKSKARAQRKRLAIYVRQGARRDVHACIRHTTPSPPDQTCVHE